MYNQVHSQGGPVTRYEMMLVLTPTLTDEEVPTALEKFQRLITDQGGVIETQEVLGRRRLAYNIRKARDGTYVLAKFEMPPQGVREVKTGARLDENILRHILVRR